MHGPLTNTIEILNKANVCIGGYRDVRLQDPVEIQTHPIFHAQSLKW